MNWYTKAIWYTPEGYQIDCVNPSIWIIYGPDGWVDCSTDLAAAKLMCETLWKKEHPV